MSRKIFILDTSVMLYDKKSIHAFTGNNIVLPLVVLEELDKFKDRRGLVGDNARYVNRFLDKMRLAPLTDDGSWKIDEIHDIWYRFETDPKIHDQVPEGFDYGYNDNVIIGCALFLKLKQKDSIIRVITKDINLRVKCDAVGVDVADYIKDRISEDVDTFKGFNNIDLTCEQIDKFYQEGHLITDNQLNENHFVIGLSNQNSMLGIYKDGVIKKLKHKMDSLIQVEPRNSEQRFAIEALLDPDIPLVTLTGLAGSGKTFLALMAGMLGVKDGKSGDYERLLITRTLQPVGRDLGFLPGSMDEKMAPWMMPILDNVRVAFKDTSYFKMQMASGVVEVAPIPYIRGRTFNNSFMIVDEAQNATIHELKTIITRMGTGSKIVLLGDIDQIDTPYIDRQSSGLSIVIDKFQNSKLAAHVNLSKGQRSNLASQAGAIL
tara:strand:+ start:1956 stop:3254 length:1299 start_codon:yes stop_codon:yes gene_type:complete